VWNVENATGAGVIWVFAFGWATVLSG